MSKVTLEPLHNASLLRIGEHNEKLGDPYETTIVIEATGDGECVIKGLDKPITFKDYRAIKKCLQDHGYRRAWWLRIKDGHERLVEVHLD